MAKFNYRMSLATEADPGDIVQALEAAGFDPIEVAVSGWNERRLVRGEAVLAILAREGLRPATETAMSRAEIATEAGVSGAMVGSVVKDRKDEPAVAAYISRTRADKAVAKAREAAQAAIAHAESLAVERQGENGGASGRAPVFIS